VARSHIMIFGVFALLAASPASAVDRECNNGLEFMAGSDDLFAAPYETASPDQPFANALAGLFNTPSDLAFDQMQTNRGLAHTFSGWHGPVCGALLELRVRAVGYGTTVDNDSIRLSFLGGQDSVEAHRYWTTIRNIQGGSWLHGDETVIILDLANLPSYVWFPTDILHDMTNGRLELLVEDDTAVDYARLNVCECVLPIEQSSFGALKARF